MRHYFLLCMTVVFFLLPSAKADSDDRAAVLEVMDQAFAAVASGRQEDWRALQLADGVSLSFRPHPDGEPEKLEMRMSTNEEFISGMEPDGRKYLERWVEAPTVLVHGSIAMVWGEYELWIDGEFAHCGVDSVNLVKVDGEWKIANFLWTVELEDCPTAQAR